MFLKILGFYNLFFISLSIWTNLSKAMKGKESSDIKTSFIASFLGLPLMLYVIKTLF